MLCGCMGYREIDRGYMVTAIGFGVDNGNTTIYIEALSTADVSDKNQERTVLTSSGADKEQAYANLISTLVKPLYFEQLGAAVFENETEPDLSFLTGFTDINLGIYIVITNDIKTLFENKTPSGVLGYDIITLIKTREKGREKRIFNQLYKSKDDKFNIPTVNMVDGNLILKQAEDG